MPRSPFCLSPHQRGSSSIEFTLTAIPVLLAGMGAIELGRWFFVKQAISLALLEAGRAAITQHARASAIEHAFEQALLPLFPATSMRSATERLQKAFQQRQDSAGVPPWQIQVIAPSTSVFKDFSTPGLTVAGATGLAVINNNYQAEQHQGYVARGWPNGLGPHSGATIFQANELALHLTYMHEPLVPGMGALLRQLMQGSSGYAQQALAGGYLPMRQTLRLTMQSHPVAWQYAGPKVLGAHSPWPAVPGEPSQSSSCRGLWCQPPRPEPVNSSGDTPFPESPATNWPEPGPGDPTGSQPFPSKPEFPPDANPVLPDPDSDSCSILCCA